MMRKIIDKAASFFKNLTWRKVFYSFFWLAIVLFAIDIASKWIVVKNTDWYLNDPTSSEPGTIAHVGKGVEVIKDFFYIAISSNTGSAFSLGAGTLWMRIIFIVISWAMSIGIAFYWCRGCSKGDKLMNAILAVVWAGAIGNLIDRTFYWEGTVGFNGVVDFLSFYIFGPNGAPFATFNVADACLVLGIIALIVLILVRSIKESLRKSAEEQKEEQLGDKDADKKD